MNEFRRWTRFFTAFALLHVCLAEEAVTSTVTPAPQSASSQTDSLDPMGSDPSRTPGHSTQATGLVTVTSDVQKSTQLNSGTAQQESSDPETLQPALNQENNIQPGKTHSSVLKESPGPKQKQGSASESTSSSAVFTSVLVTGLLLAAIIIAIYYFRCHRRSDGKGLKLVEDSYAANEENQGNNLVSVAPLNQEEPQDKPSLNGESPEQPKTDTATVATNGHSTATKSADTEM